MTIGPEDEAARDAATDSVTFAFADAEGGALRARPDRARARAGGGHRARHALRGPGARGGAGPRRPCRRAGRVLGGARAGRGADVDRAAAHALARGLRDAGRRRLRARVPGHRRPRRAGDGDPVARLGGLAGYDQPCRVRGTVRAGGRERAWTASASAATRGARRTGSASSSPAASRRGPARAPAPPWPPSGRPARATTPTRRCGGRCGSPRGCSRSGSRACRPPTTPTGAPAGPGWSCGRRATDDGWARRGAGEVLCGSSLDLGELRLDLAFFRWHLEGRAGRRPLRRDPPRRRRVIAAPVVSDFGGVLTAPLFTGFQRIQDDVGVPPEAFGAAMRAATEAAAGRNPLHRLERGEIAEQAFLADARARAGRDPRPGGHAARLRRALPRRARPQRRALRLLPRRCTSAACGSPCSPTTCASGSRTGGRSCPSTRSSRRSSTRASSACASPIRGSTRSCSSGWSCPPTRVRSSTTSSATWTPRASWASTACTSARPRRPSRSSTRCLRP